MSIAPPSGKPIPAPPMPAALPDLIDLDLLVREDQAGRRSILRQMAWTLYNAPPSEHQATLEAFRNMDRPGQTAISTEDLERELAFVQRELVEATRRASA